jgi:hypothetical protein
MDVDMNSVLSLLSVGATILLFVIGRLLGSKVFR